MPDYSLAKIYRIVCNTTGLQYIGSTCETTLARRLSGHIRAFKHYKNGKTNFITSFNVLEHGNYEIVLIENWLCNNKDELHSRERHYIETMVCVNKYVPNRTTQEYYQDNKEKVGEQMKQWRENHKEYFKQWRANNPDYHKQWREKKGNTNKPIGTK